MKNSTRSLVWRCLAGILVLTIVLCPVLEARSLIIPKGTLIKVRLGESLSTRWTKEGRTVKFTVDANVRINRRLVFAKGAPVEAYISDIRHPQRFGRNASLKIKFLSALNVKNREVPIEIGERAAKTNQQMGMAAGAAVGGALIFGPIGLLAGLFVKGKNIEIPKGTVLHVEVAEDQRF